MKNLIRNMTMVVTIVAMMGSSVYATEGLVGAGAAAAEVDYTLEEMLQYALEDERMAQAEYAVIMATFDVTRPFSNIEKAEVVHEAAVVDLYEARNLEVPSFDGADHVVIPDTLEEIYEIGIQAEINNIAMYESFLEEELDADVEAVFVALMNGSISHLEAFQRAAEGNSGQGTMNGSGSQGNGEAANGNGNRSGSQDKQSGQGSRGNGGGQGNKSGGSASGSSINRRNQSMTECPIGE